MRRWWIVGCWMALWLAGCAQMQPMSKAAPVVPPGLFEDGRFGPPSETITAEGLFDLDDAMRRFLAVDLRAILRSEGRQHGLVNALYRHDALKLRYDASQTRNAAETFAARRGNCLSLVIMTAAFAKELDLAIDYRSALIEDAWSLRGALYVGSGHVNITLGTRLVDRAVGAGANPGLMIDFLPPQELQGLRTQGINETRLVAMYLNNRSAEALAESRLDDAYAWAQAAVRQDPGLSIAYNTLGAVYRMHGDLGLATRAFRQALAVSPGNLSAMDNLVQVLLADGQPTEAAQWKQRLAAIEAYPPFHDLRQGRLALERGDWRAARDAYVRELRRSGSSAELRHGLAQAAFGMGEIAEAKLQLRLAVEESTTRGEQARYLAKLDHLATHAH